MTNQKVKENKRSPFFYLVITIQLVGFFFGYTVAKDLKNQGLLIIINDIETAIINLQVDHSFSLLIKSFFTHFIYIFIIWFLALTVIGTLVVLFINFFIGFMYGVVISSFIYQYGLKGLYIGFVYTFPQNILILPLVIYLSSRAIVVSIQIFKSLYQKNNRKQLNVLINYYFNLLFFSIGVLIIYSLIMSIFGSSFVNYLKTLI